MSDLPADSKIMHLEPTGTYQQMVNYDDVIAQANGLPYGLAAYAFTRSQKRAGEVADALQAGMVGVNSFEIAGSAVPFGGMKDSGIGREGGQKAFLSSRFRRLLLT